METKSSNLDSSVLCYEIADSPKSEESKSTIVLENPPLSPAYPPLSYDPGVIDLTGGLCDGHKDGGCVLRYIIYICNEGHLFSAKFV